MPESAELILVKVTQKVIVVWFIWCFLPFPMLEQVLNRSRMLIHRIPVWRPVSEFTMETVSFQCGLWELEAISSIGRLLPECPGTFSEYVTNGNSIT
jgi:hypothetical protein